MTRCDDVNRKAVITGGGSGIGAVIASRMHASGYDVASIDVNQDALDAMPKWMWPLRADVADPDQVQEALNRCGFSDASEQVLVNCAGVMQRRRFPDASIGDIRRLIEVNLMGVVIPTHIAVSALRPGTSLHVINIGSIWASRVWPERSAYAASKAAVEQLSRCLALEGATADPPYKVSCVSLGLVETQMTSGVLKDAAFRGEFFNRLSSGRAATPAEIAGVIDLLVGGRLDYAHGEVINLHGGYF